MRSVLLTVAAMPTLPERTDNTANQQLIAVSVAVVLNLASGRIIRYTTELQEQLKAQDGHVVAHVAALPQHWRH